MARIDPWNGIFQRFDWHCGRLTNAPRNFRKREMHKFGLFVAVLVCELSGCWHSDDPSVSVGTCALSWTDLVFAMIGRQWEHVLLFMQK
jgi:hypothetical protein